MTSGIKSTKHSARSNRCQKARGLGEASLPSSLRIDDGLPYFFSYLKAILSRDRRTYGVVPGATAAVPDGALVDGDEPPMQQRIEDLIETPGGSTEFRPPVM